MSAYLSDHCPACADERPADDAGLTPCCGMSVCSGDLLAFGEFLADGWVGAWEGRLITACCPAIADTLASEFGRQIVVAL